MTILIDDLKRIGEKCRVYFRFGPGDRACNNCLFVKHCNAWKQNNPKFDGINSTKLGGEYAR